MEILFAVRRNKIDRNRRKFIFKKTGNKPHYFDQLNLCEDIKTTINQLESLYEISTNNLNEAFSIFAKTGKRSENQQTNYPYLLLHLRERKLHGLNPSGFVSIRGPGWYGTSITHPEIFKNYLYDQLSHIQASYDVEYYVGLSDEEIPVTFAVDTSDFKIDSEYSGSIGDYFALPNLKTIHDDLADGAFEHSNDCPPPLEPISRFKNRLFLATLKALYWDLSL